MIQAIKDYLARKLTGFTLKQTNVMLNASAHMAMMLQDAVNHGYTPSECIVCMRRPQWYINTYKNTLYLEAPDYAALWFGERPNGQITEVAGTSDVPAQTRSEEAQAD